MLKSKDSKANQRKKKKKKLATNRFTTGTTNVHTNAIQCYIQRQMSLGAAVILTNLGDWKDIFGFHYLYFRSLLDKRVEWMVLSFENEQSKKAKLLVCVCVWVFWFVWFNASKKRYLKSKKKQIRIVRWMNESRLYMLQSQH